MTDGQKSALEHLWPRYGLEASSGPLDFSAIFGRRAPLSFEIGFGNGEALLARAQAHPERNHLGAEVHRPGVGRVLLNLERLNFPHVRVFSQDATDVLRDLIAPGALDEVVIQFPDPWHKTRHHKRRMIQPEFAQLLASRLAPEGRLRLATDWAPYARHMLEVLNAEPQLCNAATDGGFVPRPDSRPKTRFELRGERLGHAVFDLEYRRI